jgi:hypothetical protein
LSFFIYDASAKIAKRIAKKTFLRTQSRTKFGLPRIHANVGWVELMKALWIFGLQPTGIREDLQSWSPDLYILFMCFKDKKKNAKMEKSA